MIYFECPDNYSGTTPILFLGGGITGCPDWQKEMAELLSDLKMAVANPRRKDFDLSDEEMTVEQINWEHRYLSRADMRLFWFPQESVCPIDPLFVGCHPNYPRKTDLVVQLSLTRPGNCPLSYSTESLADRIKDWFPPIITPE